MANGPRSRRLTVPLLAPIGGVAIFTVPPNRTLILRSIVYFNPGPLPSTINASINLPDNTAILIYLASVAAGAVAMTALNDDVILNPGDRLGVQSGSGLVSTMAFGALMFGAPE